MILHLAKCDLGAAWHMATAIDTTLICTHPRAQPFLPDAHHALENTAPILRETVCMAHGLQIATPTLLATAMRMCVLRHDGPVRLKTNRRQPNTKHKTALALSLIHI